MKANRLAIPGLTDHHAASENARRAPGTWTLASVYRGSQSAEAVARSIRVGRVNAYRPKGTFDSYTAMHEDGTAVWVRYVAGIDVEPMPQMLTVRVPDYRIEPGDEGVRIRTVEISACCQRCGGPRGPLHADHFVQDGVHLVRDRWENACGHPDRYRAVLVEAQRRRDGDHARPPRRAPLQGVEGGEFTEAVNVIAQELTGRPYLRAAAAAQLLEEQGYLTAAEAVRGFVSGSASAHQTSAKSAARYLIHRDRQVRDASEWQDGRIVYDFPGRQATMQEDATQ